MSQAVGVLIVDEPAGLDPCFRATLEHMPALRTIGEADLTGTGHGTVALVFVGEGHSEANCGRIARLRETWPGLRILVLFRALGTGDLSRMIEAGANAFAGRGTPAREVCSVILALTDESGPLVTVPAVSAETSDALGLTPREAEVLRFLSAGFSNKEVARRLQLSVRTVETHRLNLRRKTQTGRLKDLVSLARQLGLDPVLDGEAPRIAAPH